MSMHIPVFRSLGYDAELKFIDGVDSANYQDVTVIDQFGNRDLPTKSLGIT